MGGKEIFIKSIAQAVPTYAMMVFKIPINICKGMTNAISQFWWGDDDDKRRIHWQAWWKLCTPKDRGGMGFRDFHCFNLAMLTKTSLEITLLSRLLMCKGFESQIFPRWETSSGKDEEWKVRSLGRVCSRAFSVLNEAIFGALAMAHR
jgi:hypothetical protein